MKYRLRFELFDYPQLVFIMIQRRIITVSIYCIAFRNDSGRRCRVDHYKNLLLPPPQNELVAVEHSVFVYVCRVGAADIFIFLTSSRSVLVERSFLLARKIVLPSDLGRRPLRLSVRR